MTVIGLLTTGILQSSTIKAGNPARLTNAINGDGQICGVSSGVQNEKYGYYLSSSGQAACVQSCPSTTSFTTFICANDNMTALANADFQVAYNLTLSGQCMYTLKTSPYLNRCFPDVDTNTAAQLFAVQANNQSSSNSSLSVAYNFGLTGEDWFYKFAMDIFNLKGYVFGFGIGVATGIAFLYTYLLRIPGMLFLVCWGTLLGVQAILLIGSFLLRDLSDQWAHDNKHTNSEVIAMRVFAYTGIAVSGLYFCLLVVMRSRIQLSIAIIKESARAVAKIPMLLLMPLIQVTGIVAFLVPW